MNSRRRQVLVAALSAVSVLGLIACDPNKPQFVSIDITGAEYARGFQLPDQNGQMRSLEEFKGKVVAVFFGYTQCPDVCPTTLTEWVEIKRQLGADGDRLQGIFITVDPQRDTPQMLQAYVDSFGSGFVALRGTQEQTEATARDFKVIFSQVAGKTPTSYTIDHTAGSYVFDAQGRIRLFTRYGTGAAALAHDLKLLLAASR